MLVLSTNTLFAYNYWGGASAYAHVESLVARQATLAQAMENAIGRLSTQRPIAPLLIAAPADMPRNVNLKKRGFEQRSWAGAEDSVWARAHAQSPYDASAGYLNKWEHHFVRWAEAEGIGLDYLTDYDLDVDPAALDRYGCVILAGHSEYWSGPERAALDRFVDRGGRLAIFSGNTGFWKVRWEDDGRTLVCHKWKGFEAEDVAPADATHLWSHPAFRRPEAEITGLSFIFGGYHRLGLCAARGAGGYTVYRDRHWALEGCDLYYGDVFGDDVPLLGYENDGCDLTFGEDGLPAPVARLGVPADLEIIGPSAPAALRRRTQAPTAPASPPNAATWGRPAPPAPPPPPPKPASSAATPSWPRSSAARAKCSTPARRNGRMAWPPATPSSPASPSTSSADSARSNHTPPIGRGRGPERSEWEGEGLRPLGLS